MPEKSHEVADIVEGIGSWQLRNCPINGLLDVSRPVDFITLKRGSTLEALAVHNRRAALVVLLLRDPHLLEGRERRENGTTDPDRVLALGGSNDLDLHRRGGERRDLLLHAVRETGVHGGTTRLRAWLAVCLHARVPPNIP